MTEIKVGDKVRDKNRIINGGLAMNVIEVENVKALCEHLEGQESVPTKTWLNISDLEVIIYGDVGFTNTGE